jgi:hypothetical protein
VGNCRSSSNFWAFISQACFIILKINLFDDTNESAKWKNNRAVYYFKKQFLCSPSCFIISFMGVREGSWEIMYLGQLARALTNPTGSEVKNLVSLQ